MHADERFQTRRRSQKDPKTMNMIDPHTAAFLAASTAAGFLMLRAGLAKSALELKRRRRTCPSCGRRIERRTCACSR